MPWVALTSLWTSSATQQKQDSPGASTGLRYTVSWEVACGLGSVLTGFGADSLASNSLDSASLSAWTSIVGRALLVVVAGIGFLTVAKLTKRTREAALTEQARLEALRGAPRVDFPPTEPPPTDDSHSAELPPAPTPTSTHAGRSSANQTVRSPGQRMRVAQPS
jgi:hypothetical protein